MTDMPSIEEEFFEVPERPETVENVRRGRTWCPTNAQLENIVNCEHAKIPEHRIAQMLSISREEYWQWKARIGAFAKAASEYPDFKWGG